MGEFKWLSLSLQIHNWEQGPMVPSFQVPGNETEDLAGWCFAAPRLRALFSSRHCLSLSTKVSKKPLKMLPSRVGTGKSRVELTGSVMI